MFNGNSSYVELSPQIDSSSHFSISGWDSEEGEGLLHDSNSTRYHLVVLHNFLLGVSCLRLNVDCFVRYDK